MKPWHAAVIGWGYMMAAYAGSFVLGRDFFIAMVTAGAVGAFGFLIAAMMRDLEQ